MREHVSQADGRLLYWMNPLQISLGMVAIVKIAATTSPVGQFFKVRFQPKFVKSDFRNGFRFFFRPPPIRTTSGRGQPEFDFPDLKGDLFKIGV